MAPIVAFVAQAVWNVGTWLATAGWAQTLVKTGLSYGLTSVVQRQLARNSGAGSFQNEAARRLTTVRASAEPRRIVYGQVRLGGVMTYAETHGEDNKYLNMIVTLTGHEINAISTVLWGDETLTFSGSDGNATNADLQHPDGDGPLLFVSKNLGADSQTADGDLTGLGLSWTSNHRQRGCANLYVRMHAEQERLTDIENITAIVQGKKVYDPRTATTVYSNNAALVIADYLMDTRYGFGIPLADIDSATLIAAANVCDENVTLNPSGTEKRYTINGSFDSSAPRGKVLQDMANAMAGSVVYSGGKYYIQAGAYTAPTITLTDDHLRGGLQIKTLDSVSECVNRVRGIYANPQANYQIDDFPTVVNATYLSEDNGEEHWRDIELPFTTSYATAQRLAKIDLERSRQEITIQYPAQLHALQLRAGDTVAITNSRMGWSAKAFDVLELKPVDDDGYLGVDLILKETASTVYTWANGEETVVDPAPNTDLPDPTTTPAPTGLAVASGTAALIAKSDGTILSRAHLTWTRPASTFAGRIEVEYKLSSGDSSDWVQLPWLSASVVDFYIADVTDGADYDFRVRSVSVLGYRSAWATVSDHTIVGKDADPAVPSGLTLTPIVEGIKVTWTQTTELDVLHGGRVWIERADDASFTTNTDVISTLPDGEHVLRELYPGQEYYVRIKHVDSTGNASAYTSGASTRVLSAPIDVPTFWGSRPIGGASDMTFELNKYYDGTSSNRSVRILGNVYVDTEGTSWPVYGPTSVSTPYTSGSIYPEYGEPGFDGSELPGRDGAFYIAHLESSAENYWPLGNFGGAEDETFFVAVAPYQQTWVATDGDGNYWTLPVLGVTIVAKVERQPGANGLTGIIPMTTPLAKPVELLLEFSKVADAVAQDYTSIPTGSKVRINGYHADHDGMAGSEKWTWNATSTATADGLTVLEPTAHASEGRLERTLNGPINVMNAGVKANGTDDDTAALEAAWAYATRFLTNEADEAGWPYFITNSLYLPGGDYKYNGTGLTATGPKAAAVKVFGDGISATRIELGASSYLFAVSEFCPTFVGIDFTVIGGLGTYINTAQVNNVSHGVTFERCAFIDFTQCAIGWTQPTDAPFLCVRNCAFTPDASSETISVVVPPGGGHIIDHNWFNTGRYDLKLVSHLVIHSGTAQAGSTSTTCKLAAGASATDDIYNHRFVIITGGTGSGQTRTVSDYDGTTKVVTVSSAWTTTPDATSEYEIAASQLGEVEITNNRFGRYGAQSGNRHNIWIVPSSDPANPGRGISIVNNFHGNENNQAGDMRILVADEHASTGTDFTDKPHSTGDSTKLLYGFRIEDNTYAGNDNTDTAPFVSYCSNIGEYKWNNLIWSTQPPKLIDVRSGEPDNNPRFYDVEIDARYQNAFGFGHCPVGIKVPAKNAYHFFQDPNALTIPGGYQSEFVEVATNRHGYDDLTVVSNAKTQITDSLGGTSAAEVDFASDSNVYYATISTANFSTGDLMWVECDLRKSATNPLDQIQVFIQESLSKKARSFVVDLADDWTRFRIPFVALQSTAAYGISFEPQDYSAGSADRFDVGLPCVYRARSPVNYGHLRAMDGTWNGSHIIMGAYHLWCESSGKFRIKYGAPTSETDGTVVGSQS